MPRERAIAAIWKSTGLIGRRGVQRRAWATARGEDAEVPKDEDLTPTYLPRLAPVGLVDVPNVEFLPLPQ